MPVHSVGRRGPLSNHGPQDRAYGFLHAAEDSIDRIVLRIPPKLIYRLPLFPEYMFYKMSNRLTEREDVSWTINLLHSFQTHL